MCYFVRQKAMYFIVARYGVHPFSESRSGSSIMPFWAGSSDLYAGYLHFFKNRPNLNNPSTILPKPEGPL